MATRPVQSPSRGTSHNHHHHHHHHQHHRSGTSESKYVRECICGRGLSCTGMTQAFRLLGDPRCYYVELPRYRKDPPAYKYVFRNNLRDAYVRHLKQRNPNLDASEFDASPKRLFVALHHFHPTVVRAFYENPLTSAQKHKVPISITEHELKELNMNIYAEDRILSVTGRATGGYYFCPSYATEKAHEDLKRLIKAARAVREGRSVPSTASSNTKEKDKIASPPRRPVPTNIEISKVESPPQTKMESTPEPIPETLPQTKQEISQETKSAPRPAPEPTNMEENNDVDDITEKVPANCSPSNKEEDGDDAKEIVSYNITEPTPKPTKMEEIDDDSSTEEVPASSSTPNQDEDGEDFKALISNANAESEFDTLWEDREASQIKSEKETSPQEDNDAKSGLIPNPNVAAHVMESSSKLHQSMSGIVTETIQEGDKEEESDHDEVREQTAAVLASTSLDGAIEDKSTTPPRQGDHPWDTPKYRRASTKPEPVKIIPCGPAQLFIDPTASMDSQDRGTSAVSEEVTPQSNEIVPSDDDVSIDSDSRTKYFVKTDPEEDRPAISAPNLSSDKPAILSLDPPGKTAETARLAFSPARQKAKVSSDDRSVASDDSVGVGSAVIALNHQLPGADPTLRIQVHNDLIAWESKRRSDLSHQLEFNREQWKAARDILRDGVQEVEFAERLVRGFSKAGSMFAGALQAMYDDKLLDDAGNTVTNPFLQNRLHKQRSTQEYNIDNNTNESAAVGGQSALLNSIIEAQSEVANVFRDSSQHLENEILPEVDELKAETKASARELEYLGDNILAELKRSEIEVKNIWDVFDAMVTGDLMEYSTHGSTHGSIHGGSQHGGSLGGSLGGQSNSIHGFLTPRGENEAPIVSSVHSPLVKSTFRQLGGVEDGWLIEMYYKTAAVYQQSVFRVAENELNNLIKGISKLEERRYRRLHQVMLAFVPRQRRLFLALPDHLTEALNDLVGLRIDAESLQTLIDDSIRDRSHNHLKRVSSHRSSIMNRSRLKVGKDSPEDEVEAIEASFGNPFDSSMVLLSRVAELKPGGLGGIVNSAWRPALVVVTSEGNYHVFELPGRTIGQTSMEAFKSLYPPMDFDAPQIWTSGRKTEIVKSLTPTLSLTLKKCSISVSKLRNRQVEVVEERTHTGGSRLLNAVKAGTQQGKRSTLRLSSVADASELVALLEKNKKELGSTSTSKPSRFRF